MASKLLNVLQNIEQSRQNIIHDANLKNYNLSEDSSFEDINDVFKQIPDTGMVTPITPAPIDTDVITQNNLKIIPEKYRTYLADFKNESNIAGWAAVFMAVVDDSYATIDFVTGNKIGGASTTAGQVSLGARSTNNYYNYQNTVNYKVVTSDGATYDFIDRDNNNTTVKSHTWDTSQDVDHERWFKVYIQPNTDSWVSPKTNFQSLCYQCMRNSAYSTGLYIAQIPVVALYFNASFTSDNSTGNCMGINYNSDSNKVIKNTYKYFFLTDVDDTITNSVRDFIISNVDISKNALPSSNNINYNNICPLFTATQSDTKLYKTLYGQTFNGAGSNFIGYLVLNRSLINSSLGLDLNTYYTSLKIVAPLRTVAGESLSAANQLYNLNRVKRSYVWTSSNNPHRSFNMSDIPFIFDDSTTTTPTTLGTVSGYNISYPYTFGGHINIPDTVNSLQGFAFFNAGANDYMLNLNGITSILGDNSLDHVMAINVKMNNLTSCSYKLFEYIYAHTLQLNGLTTMSARIGVNANCLIRLDCESLEEYLYAYPNSAAIEVINMPSLKRGIERPFVHDDNACWFMNLHTFIIGEDYETSLDLRPLVCLSNASITDIINKLKDYSDAPNTHTLTLHRMTAALLTDELKETLTDKGWNLVVSDRVYY